MTVGRQSGERNDMTKKNNNYESEHIPFMCFQFIKKTNRLPFPVPVSTSVFKFEDLHEVVDTVANAALRHRVVEIHFTDAGPEGAAGWFVATGDEPATDSVERMNQAWREAKARQ